MYTCVCNTVTEDDIKEHLKNGGLIEVISKTGAATCCGLSLEEIEKMEEQLNSSLLKKQGPLPSERG